MTPSLSKASNVSDIFEAYTFAIVIQAASSEGAIIKFSDVYGAAPTNFTFRTSPGLIYSTVRPYCHAVIEFPNKQPLEAHLGVRVSGRSKVMHECDVAVLFKSEADDCRQLQISPRSSKILLAIECKHYTTSLPLNMARAFVGLNTDLSANQSIFVTNTNSSSVEQFLSAKKSVWWEHNVKPDFPAEVDRLKKQIEVVFRNFKAKA